ncbi:cation-transporting P-type ATPase [Aeromonas popoffii]|uniref:Cation-transporting P-type ATPase n=1 Tax=Aeromonas popoffii TaxID=70856 RepID=A0ABS5GX79_9GAMM|nr:cation-transporting P-type ATPase [Aeromonas popoffii]MBR7631454.1 cation-transporting P-type ATPase [Aeromonas popoffii]
MIEKDELLKPYSLDVASTLTALNATENGLESNEAQRRLNLYGQNKLPEPEGKSAFVRFISHFKDMLVYVLLAAAIATAFLGHWVDTWVIVGVVVLNAIVSFVQEGKAETALAGIRNMLSSRAQVLRDHKWDEINADELVVGDIVRLKSGDRVPADLRLMEATGLRIEESALTGESVPADKGTAAMATDSPLGDRSCMAYSGSMVSAGRGVGVVTAIGALTEIGQISRMITEVETLDTPLTKQMDRFSKSLAWVVLSMLALMLIIGVLFHGQGIAEVFMAAIGFAVAAIPEGLPTILTITLAIGVQRMARRNAITRKLTAVETLGAITVICSDKTGTLTRNEMTAQKVLTRCGQYDVSGDGYQPIGDITIADKKVVISNAPCLSALLEVVSVANDTHVIMENDEWRIVGEPTEAALRVLGNKASFDATGYVRLAAIPFESSNKFMATLNDTPSGERKILLKGAPDRLIERCKTELNANGATEVINASYWHQQVEMLGRQGLRVLAAATCVVPSSKSTLELSDLEQEMVFVGLIGIVDPPRPEAIAAISECHKAGIRVKMITGDHADTAKAIGIEMGIGNAETIKVVTGDQLEVASDEELQQLAGSCDIFARTSPEHKLRLVMALQARGEVVAMTGDGVNDAPALKRADVGIAMGIKGTEATKDAADIVLADDNFSSIEKAIEEGRTIYDNIQKSLLFILPTNGAQGFVMLFSVLLGLTLPLTPVQILWVNMVVAVTLALALAFEPSEPNLMSRPPRKPGTSIISAPFLLRVAIVSTLIGVLTMSLFAFELASGSSDAIAKTMALNALVLAQTFYLFNSRYIEVSSLSLSRLLSNKVAWLMVGTLLLLQLAYVYLPMMNRWFGSTPLSMTQWGICILFGFIVFLIVELEKYIFRKSKKA